MQAPSPGEILERNFLTPLGLTVRQLARDLHVPVRQLNEIASGRRAVSAELALRLGRYFGMNPETWLAWQANYDLDQAERQYGKKIAELIIPVEVA